MNTPIGKRATISHSKKNICDEAILNTLKYRGVFNAGLSYFQLYTYLMSSTEIDAKLFKNRLSYLHKIKKVKIKDGKYFLYGIKASNWDAGVNNSKKHILKISEALRTLGRIKWIRLLALTGSVAAFSAKKNDDIDVFIIAEKNRIWLTRLFVVLTLKIMQKYRTDNDYVSKICPNIYISDSCLTWFEDKQNIYTANEVSLLYPIINKNNTYFEFIASNSWIATFLPNFKVLGNIKKHRTMHKNSVFVNVLDSFAMIVQLAYMKSKKTTEITTKDFIHFNKKDHSQEILQKYLNTS